MSTRMVAEMVNRWHGCMEEVSKTAAMVISGKRSAEARITTSAGLWAVQIRLVSHLLDNLVID